VLNYKLTEHDKGPGIAAIVVLNVLIDELVKKKVIDHGEVARILSIADGAISGMGETTAMQDARRVLDKMRGVSG
jgi:hypothetical protein